MAKGEKKEYGDLEDDALTSFDRVSKLIDYNVVWINSAEGFYYYQFLHIRLLSGLAMKLICDKKLTFARKCLQVLDAHTNRCGNESIMLKEGKSYAEYKSQMAYYRREFLRMKELLNTLEMNDFLEKLEEKLESKKKVLKKFGS